MFPNRMSVEAIDREIERHEARVKAFRKAAEAPNNAPASGVIAQSQNALRELAVKRAGAVKNGYYDAD